MTKDEIRQKIRQRLQLAGVASFPGLNVPVPNFVGAARAAELLTELPIWQRAKVVKVSCDASLLAVRRAALRDNKLLYVALPRLQRERCFIELDPKKLGARALCAASLHGARQYGRLVPPWEVRPVDVIVVGSLAVTRQGARVGSGGGYADLEYAFLRTEGKVRDYTPIFTTVHPLQIVEERLPMRGHDLPVDFIVTPVQVLAAPSLHPRPRGVIWEILGDEKIRSIPLLRRGRRSLQGAPTPRRL